MSSQTLPEPFPTSQSSSWLTNIQTRVENQAKVFDQNCTRLSFELRDISSSTDTPCNINMKLEVIPPMCSSVLEPCLMDKQTYFLPWEDFLRQTQSIIAANRVAPKTTVVYKWPDETSEDEEVEQACSSCLVVSTVSNDNDSIEESNVSHRSSCLDEVRQEHILSFLEQLDDPNRGIADIAEGTEQMVPNENPENSAAEIHLISESVLMPAIEDQNSICSIQNKATSPVSDASEAVEVQMRKEILSDVKEELGNLALNKEESSPVCVSVVEQVPGNVAETTALTDVESTETSEVSHTKDAVVLDVIREATNEQISEIGLDCKEMFAPAVVVETSQQNLLVNVISALQTSVEKPDLEFANPTSITTQSLEHVKTTSEEKPKIFSTIELITCNPTNTQCLKHVGIFSEEVAVNDDIVPVADNCLNVSDFEQQSETIQFPIISRKEEYLPENRILEPTGVSDKANQDKVKPLASANMEKALEEVIQTAPKPPVVALPHIVVEDDPLDFQQLTWIESATSSEAGVIVVEQALQNEIKAPLTTSVTEMVLKEEAFATPVLDQQSTTNSTNRKPKRQTQQRSKKISLEKVLSKDEIVPVTVSESVKKEEDKVLEKRSKKNRCDKGFSREEIVPIAATSNEMVEQAIPETPPKPEAIRNKNIRMSKKQQPKTMPVGMIPMPVPKIAIKEEVVVLESVPEVRTALKVSTRSRRKVTEQEQQQQRPKKRVSFDTNPTILNASYNEKNSPKKTDNRPALPSSAPFVYSTKRTLESRVSLESVVACSSSDPYDISLINDDGDSTFEKLFPRRTSTPNRESASSSTPSTKLGSSRRKPKGDQSPLQAESDPNSPSQLSQESPSSLDRDIQIILQHKICEQGLNLDGSEKIPKPKKVKREKKLDLGELQEVIRTTLREEFRASIDRLRRRFRPAVRKPRRILIKKFIIPRRNPSEDKATQTECLETTDVGINTDAIAQPETPGIMKPVKKRSRAPAKKSKAKKIEEALFESELLTVEDVPKSGKPPSKKPRISTRNKQKFGKILEVAKRENPRTSICNNQPTLSQCLKNIRNSTGSDQDNAEFRISPVLVSDTPDLFDHETQNDDKRQPVEEAAPIEGYCSDDDNLQDVHKLAPTKGCYRTPPIFNTQLSNNTDSLRLNNSNPNNASVALVDQDIEQRTGFSQLIHQILYITRSPQNQSVPNSQQSIPEKITRRSYRPRHSLKPYPLCPKLSAPSIERKLAKLVLPIEPIDYEPSFLDPIAIGPVNDPGLYPEECLMYIGKRLVRYDLDRKMPHTSDMYVQIACWDGPWGLNLDESSGEENGNNAKEPAGEDAIDHVMFRVLRPVCSSIKSSQEPGRFSPGLSPISHRDYEEDSGPVYW